jgi:hypothetical protein
MATIHARRALFSVGSRSPRAQQLRRRLESNQYFRAAAGAGRDIDRRSGRPCGERGAGITDLTGNSWFLATHFPCENSCAITSHSNVLVFRKRRVMRLGYFIFHIITGCKILEDTRPTLEHSKSP